MSIRSQIEGHICAVIKPMIESDVEILSPEVIADLVDQRLDPEQVAPQAKTYASVMHLRAEVRKYLARHFDPVEKAKRSAAGEQSDLFAGVLQDYYPVIRLVDGEQTLAYTPRDCLSRADTVRLVQRMEKAGRSLIKHAKALQAYVQERAA